MLCIFGRVTDPKELPTITPKVNKKEAPIFDLIGLYLANAIKITEITFFSLKSFKIAPDDI